MMKRGKNIIRSYMTLDYQFSGIRVQEGYLTPVDWILKVNLTAADKKGKSQEELEYKAATTFQKLYFWLDTNLPNIMMVNVENELDLYLANSSSNIMMYCPGNPGDDTIVQLLHSKLSTLANNHLIVGEFQLKSSDTALQYTFDCDINESYLMPKTTTEYYKESSTRDTIPWWSRDDGFCFEFTKPDDSDLADEELFKDIVDPMDEFEKIISEMSESSTTLIKEPANIVQLEKWKPKKV